MKHTLKMAILVGLAVAALLVVQWVNALRSGDQDSTLPDAPKPEIESVAEYPVHVVRVLDIDGQKQCVLDVSSNEVRPFEFQRSEPEESLWAKLAETGDIAWENEEGGVLIVASKRSVLLPGVGDEAVDLPLDQYVMRNRPYIKAEQYKDGALQLIDCSDNDQAVVATVRQEGIAIELIYARRSDDPRRFDKMAARAVYTAWRKTQSDSKAHVRPEGPLPVHTTTLKALHLPKANMLNADDATTVSAPSPPVRPTDPAAKKAYLEALDIYYKSLGKLCDAAYGDQLLNGLLTPRLAAYVGEGPMTRYTGADLAPLLRRGGHIFARNLSPGAVIVFQTRLDNYVLAEVVSCTPESVTFKWVLHQPDGAVRFPQIATPEGDQPVKDNRSDAVTIIVPGLPAEASDLNKLQALAAITGGLTPQQREQIKTLMSRGANPTETLAISATSALQMAAMVGNLDAIKIMIEGDAQLDQTGLTNSLALHIAARTGQTHVVRFLLSQGADPSIQTDEGRNALQMALLAREPNPDTVKLLRTAMKDHIDLFTAIELRDVAIVRALLEDGADTHKTNQKGSAPLHIAAQLGYPEICRLLLEHGADVSQKVQDARPRYQRTPLELAAGRGHVDVIKVLLDTADDPKVSAQDINQALNDAVTTGQAAAADALLKAGADPVFKPKSGRFTTLEAATIYGSPMMMQAFADAGVKLPLWVHSRLGDIDAVTTELGSGGDVNGVDPMGRTALFHAARSGHEQIVSLLIKAGADVNRAETDNPQETPLHVAAETGNLGIVRLLVANGAKVNTQAIGGRTPLYMAVGGRHLDVTKFLLESKADPNLTPRLLPKNGRTRRESLLDVARRNEPMQELLRKYGAK